MNAPLDWLIFYLRKSRNLFHSEEAFEEKIYLSTENYKIELKKSSFQ